MAVSKCQWQKGNKAKNLIWCLGNVKFIIHSDRVFDDHDELTGDYSSSAGNFFGEQIMLPENGFAYVPRVLWPVTISKG